MPDASPDRLATLLDTCDEEVSRWPGTHNAADLADAAQAMLNDLRAALVQAAPAAPHDRCPVCGNSGRARTCHPSNDPVSRTNLGLAPAPAAPEGLPSTCATCGHAFHNPSPCPACLANGPCGAVFRPPEENRMMVARELESDRERLTEAIDLIEACSPSPAMTDALVAVKVARGDWPAPAAPEACGAIRPGTARYPLTCTLRAGHECRHYSAQVWGEDRPAPVAPGANATVDPALVRLWLRDNAAGDPETVNARDLLDFVGRASGSRPAPVNVDDNKCRFCDRRFVYASSRGQHEKRHHADEAHP
jgi:hypothetical protein